MFLIRVATWLVLVALKGKSRMTELIETNKIEAALMKGQLNELTEAERLSYFLKICASLGLNPLTQPFQYMNLSGKLILYATRACAEQLRQINKISIKIVSKERLGDIYVVTARAIDKYNREDEATGAVSLGNARGEALANLLMKAETKAKRRVTLSISGLGFLDETEVETIPGAQKVSFSVSEPQAKPEIGPSNETLPLFHKELNEAKGPLSEPIGAPPRPPEPKPEGKVIDVPSEPGKPSIAEQVPKMLAAFLENHGMERAELEKLLGKRVEEFGENELQVLRQIYRGLDDKKKKAEKEKEKLEKEKATANEFNIDDVFAK